jgi:hypothetical protein
MKNDFTNGFSRTLAMGALLGALALAFLGNGDGEESRQCAN